jgi:hypothetical protein
MSTENPKINAGQAKQAAKTTIVGGQPPGNQRLLNEVPVGLEQLLAMAAASGEFARALREEPDSAIAACGVRLTDTERAVLRATPRPMLAKMIAQVESALPRPERRLFLEQAAAALAVLLGAGTLAACKDSGKGTKSGGVSDPMDTRRPMDAMKRSTDGGVKPDKRPVPPAIGGVRPDKREVPQAGATIERPRPSGRAGVRVDRPMVPKKRPRPRPKPTRGSRPDRFRGDDDL